MKGLFKQIKQDKIMSGGMIITYLIIAISLAYIFLSLNNLPPYIPLYNQLPWGTDRLAPTLMIFLPIAVAVVVNISNTIISSIIYAKSQIISRMLSVTSALISFLSFLFILRTIELIT